jgi:hypothetical protein
MSAHWSLDELREWIADGEPEPPSHVESCTRCRRSYGIALGLSRLAARPLPTVPRRLQNAIRRIPLTTSTIPRVSRVRRLEWTPPDVRAGTLTAGSPGHVLTQSSPEAEVSVVARPPGGDGTWHFEGRVWFHEPDERPARVVLAQGDHVLATTELRDGGHFRLADVVGRGWNLEVHLPVGRVLTVGDPGP